MEVIWHKCEFVEQVFALLPIVEENVNEQLGHPIRLQNAALLKRRSRNEVTTMSGGAARRCGHKAPRRLKADLGCQLMAALKALRHPAVIQLKLCPKTGSEWLILFKRQAFAPVA